MDVIEERRVSPVQSAPRICARLRRPKNVRHSSYSVVRNVAAGSSALPDPPSPAPRRCVTPSSTTAITPTSASATRRSNTGNDRAQELADRERLGIAGHTDHGPDVALMGGDVEHHEAPSGLVAQPAVELGALRLPCGADLLERPSGALGDLRGRPLVAAGAVHPALEHVHAHPGEIAYRSRTVHFGVARTTCPSWSGGSSRASSSNRERLAA